MYKRKGTNRKWTNEDVVQAISGVVRRVMIPRDAVDLYHTPYSRLKYQVNISETLNALRRYSKPADHSTAFFF
jgi:hypothetical protein